MSAVFFICEQSDKVCLYNYVVEQQYFDGDAKQNITISADVEISCHSGIGSIYLSMSHQLAFTVHAALHT